MKPIVFAIAAAAAMISQGVMAAAALERVESPVYQAQGDRQAIIKRATICISQVIKPGQTAAPTILTSDADAGVIVANNAFTFLWGMIPQPITARTTLTLQAKDGRFRIVHTNIEQFADHAGWQPVWTGTLTTGKAANAALLRLSDDLAACVKSPGESADF